MRTALFIVGLSLLLAACVAQQQVWSVTVGGSVYGGVSHGAGQIYVGSLGGVYALTDSTGATAWSNMTSTQYAPHYSESSGFVFAIATGSYSPNPTSIVTAYGASYGTVEWTATLTGGISSRSGFSSQGGVLYAVTSNAVTALLETNGKTLWAWVSPNVSTTFTEQLPVYYSGSIYIADTSGNLFSISASTGLLQWTAYFASGTQASVAVGYSGVYVSSYSYAYGFSLSTGSQLWQTSVTGAVGTDSGMMFYNGYVYIAYNNAQVVSKFDGYNGAIQWSASLGSGSYTLPKMYNGVVYVATTSGTLVAVSDASGSVLSTSTITPNYASDFPTITSGGYYVVAGYSTVTAVNLLASTPAPSASAALAQVCSDLQCSANCSQVQETLGCSVFGTSNSVSRVCSGTWLYVYEYTGNTYCSGTATKTKSYQPDQCVPHPEGGSWELLSC